VTEPSLAPDVVLDLMRSAWVVERARAVVYDAWEPAASRFRGSRERAEERAGIIDGWLSGHGVRPDAGLVDAHAEWMLGVVDRASGAVPFGDLLLVRLGDWVDAHAATFLERGAERLAELGSVERASVRWPEEAPPPLPFARIDSSSVEAPGGSGFRFAILSDIHIGSAEGEATARAAVADINRSGAELVIQLGDLTEHGNEAEFELAARVLAELEAPVSTMMGNHDVYSYEEEALSGPGHYRTHFGRAPDGALIEHKGLRFALLDSAEIGASPFAPFNLVTGGFMEGKGGAIVRGSISVAQHEILAEVAEPHSPPAFVFLHHPPQPFTSFPPIIFGLRELDSGRLHAACDSGNVWGVFAGHTHRNARGRSFGRVPVQEVGVPCNFPFGYALVDVTGAGYAYRFVQLSDEELLREGYRGASELHRRYALGPPEARSFVWRKNEGSGA
jgi:hypothetical protein